MQELIAEMQAYLKHRNTAAKRVPASAVLARLITARKMAGLTQSEAARMVGLAGASSLSDIESGRCDLLLSRLLALCEAYNISPAWVVGGSDD